MEDPIPFTVEITKDFKRYIKTSEIIVEDHDNSLESDVIGIQLLDGDNLVEDPERIAHMLRLAHQAGKDGRSFKVNIREL